MASLAFPKETRFTLIPHGQSTLIAWLQSATTPGLAFPVVSAHGLLRDYPDVPIEPLVDKAGIAGSGADEFAVLAVLCASQLQPATVNLLAPLLDQRRHAPGRAGVSRRLALHDARAVRLAHGGARIGDIRGPAC